VHQLFERQTPDDVMVVSPSTAMTRRDSHSTLRTNVLGDVARADQLENGL